MRIGMLTVPAALLSAAAAVWLGLPSASTRAEVVLDVEPARVATPGGPTLRGPAPVHGGAAPARRDGAEATRSRGLRTASPAGANATREDTLRLRVVDLRGRPIAGAEVDFWLDMDGRDQREPPGHGTREPFARTDAEGMTPVPFWVRQSAFGVYRVRGHGASKARLPKDRTDAIVTVRMARLAEVHGHVFDERGRPLPDAVITLFHADRAHALTTNADASGAWSIWTPPGSVRLELRSPEGALAATRVVLAEAARHRWDPQLEAARVIAGTVHVPDLTTDGALHVRLHHGGPSDAPLTWNLGARPQTSPMLHDGDPFRFIVPRKHAAYHLAVYRRDSIWPLRVLGPFRGAQEDLRIDVGSVHRETGTVTVRIPKEDDPYPVLLHLVGPSGAHDHAVLVSNAGPRTATFTDVPVGGGYVVERVMPGGRAASKAEAESRILARTGPLVVRAGAVTDAGTLGHDR